MLLALKLLAVLGVLSYAVAAILSERELILSGFQAPLSHFLRGARYHTHTNKAAIIPSSQSEAERDPLLRRPRTTLYSKAPGTHKALTRQRQHNGGGGGLASYLDYYYLGGGGSSGSSSTPSSSSSQRVITTVDGLRIKHGSGSFWGDLNHIETRWVYHQLLPHHLLQDALTHTHTDKNKNNKDTTLAVEDLARVASMARHAARLYARERSSLPLRVLAGLYDGFRHLHAFGRWSWTGMSYEEVWMKYERKVKEELQGTQIPRQELNRLVALRILQKSCETNAGFDKFAQIERAHEILAAAAVRKEKRQQRAKIKEGMDTETLTQAQVPAFTPVVLKKEKVLSAHTHTPTQTNSSSSSSSSSDASWVAKKSPLLPLLEHFQRLGNTLSSLP